MPLFTNLQTQLSAMRFWWILILLLFSGVVNAQQPNCSKFRTGTFLLLDGVSTGYTIFRNDTLQSEKSEKSMVSTDFYIRWINDCSYELTLRKMHNRPAGLNMPDNPIKLNVTIYKVSGDTCWVKTKSNNSKYIIKNRMVKIKKQ